MWWSRSVSSITYRPYINDAAAAADRDDDDNYTGMTAVDSLTLADWTLVPTSQYRTAEAQCYLAVPQTLRTEYWTCRSQTAADAVVECCRSVQPRSRTTRSLGADRSNLHPVVMMPS